MFGAGVHGALRVIGMIRSAGASPFQIAASMPRHLRALYVVIIRRFASSQQLITQPAHAALAARMMMTWQLDHFAESRRRGSILRAIEQHDDGWADIDEALVVDDASGRLLDFIELPDALKREASSRGIQGLSHDPYAAALVAQHRLHVYRRYAEYGEWSAFFAQMRAARDSYLGATEHGSLDDLVRDYRLVRAGDLASLVFCNNGTDVGAEECGYAMRLEGTTLFVAPDPFGGRTVEIDIDAREIGSQSFTSAAGARHVVASAPVVRLRGLVKGAPT
jgi:hypothetical protein